MSQPANADFVRYHVLMLTFEGTGTADEVHDRLKNEDALEGCEIEGEAVIWRDPDGKVHLREKGGAGVGAAFGATAAGVVGLLAGPILLPVMIIVGGVLGGLAGHFAGQVLPPDDLRRVAEALPPGRSAYIAVVDAVHAGGVAAAFAREGAEVLDIPVETELSSVIREGITHQVTRA